MGALRKLVVIVVVLAVVAVGGTYVYFHFISDDAPPELTLEDDTTASTQPESAGVDLTGTWAAGSGSVGRYRVNEVAFGQKKTAVGETDDVTGELAIAGTSVDKASVEVDLTTVKSDEDRRDSQFQGRIMDVEHFPKATFVLAQPIDLGTLPPLGKVVTTGASGDLTLRGTTKRVNVTLKAKRSADSITVQGSIPIVFDDWKIPNPSFGPVSTEDHGSLEFLVVYRKS